MKKWHGWVFLTLWAILILAGIAAKRIWGHPDWMVFFHLPAAFALVLSFYVLSADVRARYRQEMLKWKEEARRKRSLANKKRASRPESASSY